MDTSPAASHSRKALAVEIVAVALGAVLLSVLASWPLAIQSGSSFPSSPDMVDLQGGMWLPWHLLTRVASLESPWWAPELLWPVGQRVDTTMWNLGVQVFQLPLYLFFHPVQAYNLSLVLFAALNGVAGWIPDLLTSRGDDPHRHGIIAGWRRPQ